MTPDEARKLAAYWHDGQVDLVGAPYVRHPVAVAELVAAAGGSEDQQVAAFLHDVVEDTACTLADLRRAGASPAVLAIVDALTHRDGESRADYLARVAACPPAVLVKRCDVAHNMDPARRARLDPATAERLAARYADSLASLDLILLPKAHLHLHLDGAMRPATLAELAARYGIPAPLPTGYGSFAAFTATITAAAACLRSPQDARRLVTEVVEDAAGAGAVWVEPSVWPGLFGGRLGPDADALDLVLDAGHAAAARCGIGFGLVVAANRDRGPAEALATARLAASRAGDGVVGFGLDGDEAAAGPVPFAEAFAVARNGGLRAVPHAGELAGPESVRAALDLLGADRIMHGVRAVEDPALVDRLAAAGTPLDVCPTSNVKLGVVPSLAEHPLPALVAAGVRCGIHADDPLLFGTDLRTEYDRCRPLLGDAGLAAAATVSVRASAAPAGLVAEAVRGIKAWLDT
ncbi:MAG: adenosine deaminase [Mycobacteriales bacterium]